MIRLYLTAAALFLAACASAPPPAPDLRVAGNRLFIPAEINGQRVEALLDSGAGMTRLDAAAAARLDLGTAGSADVRGSGAATEEVTFAEGLQTRAAGITLENQTAAILGREIFEAARLYLDIETSTFRTTGDTALGGAVRLPLTDAKGIKQVPIRIEGQPEILADFDIGNGSRVLVSEAFARRAGLLDPARITGTESGGGIGGPVTRPLVTLETFEIAGNTIRNVDAEIDPSPDAPEANVGVSVLRRTDMLIDFPGGAVWLRPRAG